MLFDGIFYSDYLSFKHIIRVSFHRFSYNRDSGAVRGSSTVNCMYDFRTCCIHTAVQARLADLHVSPTLPDSDKLKVERILKLFVAGSPMDLQKGHFWSVV